MKQFCFSKQNSFRWNQCSLTLITANNELGKYDLSPYGHDLQLVYLISATFSTEVLSYRVQSGIWAKTSSDFAIAGLFQRVLPKRLASTCGLISPPRCSCTGVSSIHQRLHVPLYVALILQASLSFFRCVCPPLAEAVKVVFCLFFSLFTVRVSGFFANRSPPIHIPKTVIHVCFSEGFRLLYYENGSRCLYNLINAKFTYSWDISECD